MVTRPHSGLSTAARRQLVAVAAIGFLLGIAVALVWASFLPEWLLFFFVVPSAVVIFWTLARQLGVSAKVEADGEERTIVSGDQIWRDPSAPDELVRVTRVVYGTGVAVIERIAGAYPVTHNKPFSVSIHKLQDRFELLRCLECGAPSGGVHRSECVFYRLPQAQFVEVGHCVNDGELEGLGVETTNEE